MTTLSTTTVLGSSPAAHAIREAAKHWKGLVLAMLLCGGLGALPALFLEKEITLTLKLSPWRVWIPKPCEQDPAKSCFVAMGTVDWPSIGNWAREQPAMPGASVHWIGEVNSDQYGPALTVLIRGESESAAEEFGAKLSRDFVAWQKEVYQPVLDVRSQELKAIRADIPEMLMKTGAPPYQAASAKAFHRARQRLSDLSLALNTEMTSPARALRVGITVVTPARQAQKNFTLGMIVALLLSGFWFGYRAVSAVDSAR